MASNHQKLEEAGGTLPLQPAEEACQPSTHLDRRLLASRLRECTAVARSPQSVVICRAAPGH